MQLIGPPPKPDFLFELLTQVVLDLKRHGRVGLQLLEKIGDPSLLMADGMANNLRGMGGEDQSNIQLLKQGFNLGWRHVHAPESLENFAECGGVGLARQWGSKGVKGLAAASVLRFPGTEAVEVTVFLDALFEDVDQLEVKRESSRGGNRF